MNYSAKVSRAMSDARNQTGDYTWHSSCGRFLVFCEQGEPVKVIDRTNGRNVFYLGKRWDQ